MFKWRLTAAVAASLLLFGCSTAPQRETPVLPETLPEKEPVQQPDEAQDFVAGDIRLRPAQFADLPATRDEDWEQALKAFQVSCTTMQHHTPYVQVAIDGGCGGKLAFVWLQYGAATGNACAAGNTSGKRTGSAA